MGPSALVVVKGQVSVVGPVGISGVELYNVLLFFSRPLAWWFQGGRIDLVQRLEVQLFDRVVSVHPPLLLLRPRP